MSRVSVTCEKCGKATQRAASRATVKPCPKKGCGGAMTVRVPGVKSDDEPAERFRVTGTRSAFEGMRVPLVSLPDDIRVARSTLMALRKVNRRRPAEVAATILNDWAKGQRGIAPAKSQ